MTWFELIKVKWKTKGSHKGREAFSVKEKVWNEEAGLDYLGGKPTMQEFEEHLGRKLTIDDMSPDLIDPNSDSVVIERFGKEAVTKLAEKWIEEFMELSGGKLDIGDSQRRIMEGISPFLWYIEYYPNGKYSDEIRMQLKGKETMRNEFGFDVII